VDNGSSHHMTRMRLMFLSVSETNSDCHVDCGTSTMHAMKGFGRVSFQPESGGSLEVAEVLFVPEMKVGLLSVSTLEDEGYGVIIQHGHMHIYLEAASLDAVAMLSVRQGRLYRLLGILDSGLVSVTGGCEAISNIVRNLS
jgi:hypothetical protein